MKEARRDPFPIFRSAVLLIAAAASSPSRAGTPYAQAVGVPPVCTSLQWRPWYFKLLAYRLTECPVSRAATYYFSQSGNDATGDGSQGNPWKSLAKAQSVLSASSGNIALLFRRGDVWKETVIYTFPILSGGSPGSPAVTVKPNETASLPVVGQIATLIGGTAETIPIHSYGVVNGVETLTFAHGIAGVGHTGVQLTLFSGLYVSQPNLTIGAWGDGARKPIFSAFADALPANQFVGASTRGDGYNLTWSQTDLNTVGWVREAGDVTHVYRRLTSAAQVDMTPGSWYQDLATHLVYIHALDDLTLTVSSAGRNFEAVPVNNAIGVYVSDVDGTRVDGIRVDGYGCALNNTLDPIFRAILRHQRRGQRHECLCRFQLRNILQPQSWHRRSWHTQRWNHHLLPVQSRVGQRPRCAVCFLPHLRRSGDDCSRV